MRADRAQSVSRLLFVLALSVFLLSLFWALRTPPPPSADRYDYVGRAFQATQGEGLRTLVGYPLRMSFPGSESWPPTNMTRPPLWPALLVPGLRLGLDARSGVWISGIFALLLLWGMRWVGDRSFGGAAGAMAALALTASFSSWTVLGGGGPEFALALLTLVLWTWIPRGGGAISHLACGTLYGLLPLLHPTGWIFATAALLARSNRYDRSGLPWLALGAILVAFPWHLQLWLTTGHPMGALQSYAELARNLDDPGGLGPYRGLEPVPTLQLLSERGADVWRLTQHRLKMDLLHLDAWLSWPLAVLALYGATREPKLALRDMGLGLGVFVLLAPWSAEYRTLLPLLPIACLWVGVGFSRLVDRVPLAVAILLGLLAVLGPWVLPLGASQAPPRQPAAWTPAQLAPPAALIYRLREAEPRQAPIFTDSAVLAWGSRRGALLLPDTPRTLETLLEHPALRSVRVLALGLGRESNWCSSSEWQHYLDRCTVLYTHPEGGLLLRVPSAEASVDGAGLDPPEPDDAALDSLVLEAAELRGEDHGLTVVVDSTKLTLLPPPVDREHLLPADFIPEDLVELSIPPATRAGLRLRVAAADALLRMVTQAREDEVELRVVSAYRSYQRQEQLFASAEARFGAGQHWVAPPGASEHQLGTTVDFADEASQHVLQASFAGTDEGRWLAQHASRFGFVMSYPPGSLERTGYNAEPWHFRFVEATRPDVSAGSEAEAGSENSP